MANVESPKKLPIQLGLAVACRDLGPDWETDTGKNGRAGTIFTSKLLSMLLLLLKGNNTTVVITLTMLNVRFPLKHGPPLLQIMHTSAHYLTSIQSLSISQARPLWEMNGVIPLENVV